MSEVNIVMYHYVRAIHDSDYPSIKGLEISAFRRQLDYLCENFNIIKAEDLIAHVKFGAILPKKSCLLTFDDGYKDHITFVLPELLKRKLHGAFFPPVKPVSERQILDVNRVHFILASEKNSEKLVSDLEFLCREYGVSDAELRTHRKLFAKPSRYDAPEVMYIKSLLQHALSENIRTNIASQLFRAYIGRSEVDFSEELYLSVEDTKKLLDSGMYVGSHGYRHLWLERESYASQSFEIDHSLAFLNSIGARTKDWIMCYPYGSYNQDTLNILEERNCAVGLTTKVGRVNTLQHSALEMPRFDTNDFPQ